MYIYKYKNKLIYIYIYKNKTIKILFLNKLKYFKNIN